MTAPRTCRACGAELRGDVMWCLRCYEPVRQLTPRAPQVPVVVPVATDDGRERSRWRAGATTFGPAGRIGVTALVLAFAPWSMLGNLVGVAVLWPAYLSVAGLILRSTWRKDLVMTEAPSAAEDEPRPAPVKTPVPTSTKVAWGALVALGLGFALTMGTAGETGRALLMIAASLAALVVAVRWLLAT